MIRRKIKTEIITQLDAVLIPIGFMKKGVIWNRESASSIDVIDLQISANREACTLSMGVLDKETHEIFWGEPPPRKLQISRNALFMRE